MPRDFQDVESLHASRCELDHTNSQPSGSRGGFDQTRWQLAKASDSVIVMMTPKADALAMKCVRAIKPERLSTQKIPMKGFKSVIYILSPFPSFLGTIDQKHVDDMAAEV